MPDVPRDPADRRDVDHRAAVLAASSTATRAGSTRAPPGRSPGRSCPRRRESASIVRAHHRVRRRVVHQHVECAEPLDGRGDAGLGLVRARRHSRRTWRRARPGTVFSIPAAASSRACLLARGEHHRCALVGRTPWPCPRPMPFDAPGDERDLAVERSQRRLRCSSAAESRARRRSAVCARCRHPAVGPRTAVAVARVGLARDHGVMSGTAAPDRVVPTAPPACRVHPRARRPPRARGHRRAALPRRRALDARRVPRRRRVLRDQRLPDHVACCSPTAQARRRRVRPLLPPPGPTPAPGAVPDARRGRRSTRSSSCPTRSPSSAGERVAAIVLRRELVPDLPATCRTSWRVGRPPLLQHVWSLAVEEQFYLIWPLILVLHAHGVGRAAHACCSLARRSSACVVSTLVLWRSSTTRSPIRRASTSAPTRASSTMLIGAALAIVWTPWRLRPRPAARRRCVLDAIGGVGLVVLVLDVPQRQLLRSNLLYRGGFLVVALFAAVLIAATVHPASRLGPRCSAVAVFRWIGVRSYGIYLWHWPIFMVTRPALRHRPHRHPAPRAADRAHVRAPPTLVVPLRGGADPPRRARALVGPSSAPRGGAPAQARGPLRARRGRASPWAWW